MRKRLVSVGQSRQIASRGDGGNARPVARLGVTEHTLRGYERTFHGCGDPEYQEAVLR
jgi:hypothetical protein